MKNKKDLSANLLVLALFVITCLNYAESLPQIKRYRRHTETTEISLSDETNTTDTDLLLFTGSEYSESIISDETVNNTTDLDSKIDSNNATNSLTEESLVKSESQEPDVNVVTEYDVPVDNELSQKIQEEVASDGFSQESNDLNDDVTDLANEDVITTSPGEEIVENSHVDIDAEDEDEESHKDTEEDRVKDNSEVEESNDDDEVEESKDDDEVEESKDEADEDSGSKDENESDVDDQESKENDEGVFRTHTDMGNQLKVNPKFNHTVKQIPKEVRLVADCPDVSCDFGYQTDLNGKTLCTCYEPCADNKCGNKHCIIKQINDKFQGVCVDPEKTERPEKCHLPVQKGRCRNYDSRYYFNTYKNSCEHFVFRGCDGNENNFKTWDECNTECNVCSQPPQTGKCRGHFIRYYFERSSGSCVAFSYSGCDGNKNNFNSLRQCQDTCL